MLFTSKCSRLLGPGFAIERHSGLGIADSQVTVIVPAGKLRLVGLVTVKYSGPVTLSVTVTLNSGLGVAWDALYDTITFSAQASGIWMPDRDVWVANDDGIDVVAPAGGVGVTCAVAVYTRIL